jgi:hypothetical protein
MKTKNFTFSGLMGGNDFWTFLKCPKIKSSESTPKIPRKKSTCD